MNLKKITLKKYYIFETAEETQRTWWIYEDVSITPFNKKERLKWLGLVLRVEDSKTAKRFTTVLLVQCNIEDALEVSGETVS